MPGKPSKNMPKISTPELNRFTKGNRLPKPNSMKRSMPCELLKTGLVDPPKCGVKIKLQEKELLPKRP